MLVGRPFQLDSSDLFGYHWICLLVIIYLLLSNLHLSLQPHLPHATPSKARTYIYIYTIRLKWCCARDDPRSFDMAMKNPNVQLEPVGLESVNVCVFFITRSDFPGGVFLKIVIVTDNI